MRFFGPRRLVLTAAACLLCTSCSVTRRIADGDYLVRQVRIEEDRSVPREERIRSSELERYVRQSPNSRFLGLNIGVWIYEQADTARHNWWNNWKRRLGQEPVLLDMALTERSARNLKVYMDSRGYLSSQSTFEVDTLSRPKRASVTYRIRQREPYRIDSIRYDFRDSFLEQLVLPDTSRTLLRRGDIFDIAVLDAERERIASLLRRQGYYNFSVNDIEYVADTLAGDRTVDLTVVVKQYLAGYDARGGAIRENHTVYRIDRINVYPNYDPAVARSGFRFRRDLDTLYYRGLHVIYDGRPNLRPSILRQTVPLYPNYVYNADQVDRTYSDLMALGYFRSTKVSFSERQADADTMHLLTYVGGATVDSARRTREGHLVCDILCTPALRQSFKVELEGSTTASFYGLKATVGYQNRNIFRGAEALDISVSGGYEFMKAPDARKRMANEFGASVSLSFPRFLMPFRTQRYRSVNQPRTKAEFSINFQDRPFYRRTLSSFGLTYMWSNARYSSFSLRPVDINVVDMGFLDERFLEGTQNEYLRESFRTSFIAGLNFGYVYNNQLRNLGGNATLVRFNLETAGNLIDGLEHLFSQPVAGESYYHIFGIRYSQYVRSDLSLSRKIMLGDRVALAGRIYGGVAWPYGNSDAMPFDRLFYAGGSNGMRGWSPRTLGPGATPRVEHAEYPMQLGDLKLEANLELRFPVWGILHGALFLDAGNVWYMDGSRYAPEAIFHIRDFYRQLGFNTGLGLRFDIRFAVLRLDWGLQLHNPGDPAGERWIHDFRWRNMALNFGVGYPF